MLNKNMKVPNPNPNKTNTISLLTLLNYANDSSYPFQQQAIDILNSLRRQGVVSDSEVEKAKKSLKEDPTEKMGEDGVKQDDEILTTKDGQVITKDILNTPEKLSILEKNKNNLNFLPLLQYIDEEHLHKFADSDAPQVRKAVAERISPDKMELFFNETNESVLDVVAERITSIDGEKLLKVNKNVNIEQLEKINKKIGEYNDFIFELQSADGEIRDEQVEKIYKLQGNDFLYAMDSVRDKILDNENFIKNADPKKLASYIEREFINDPSLNPETDIKKELRTNKVKVFRGGDFQDNRGYVSVDKDFASGFGVADEWEIDKDKILDLSNPEHRELIKNSYGIETLAKLSPKGDLPIAGDENTVEFLEKISRKLGFVGSAQSEGEGLPISFDIYDVDNSLEFPTPDLPKRDSIFGKNKEEISEILSNISKTNYDTLLELSNSAIDPENKFFAQNPEVRNSIAKNLKSDDVPMFAEDDNDDVRMTVAKNINPKLAKEYVSGEKNNKIVAEYLKKMKESDLTDDLLYNDDLDIRKEVANIIKTPKLVAEKLQKEVEYDNSSVSIMNTLLSKLEPSQMESVLFPLFQKNDINFELKSALLNNIRNNKIKDSDFKYYSDFLQKGNDADIIKLLAKSVSKNVANEFFNSDNVNNIIDRLRLSPEDSFNIINILEEKMDSKNLYDILSTNVDYLSDGDLDDLIISGALKSKFQKDENIDLYLDLLNSVKQKFEENNYKTRYSDDTNVHSKSFKLFFGDWENDPENSSKVIDENGTPLVVYHGSNTENINEFKRGNYGGIYFASTETGASIYGKHIYKNFLNIKSPMKIQYDFIDNVSKEEFESLFFLPKDIVAPDPKFGDTGSIWEFIDDDVIEYLKIQGYDGIFAEEDNNDIFIAFEPNQIKSIYNETFDVNNPDIRYQIIGERGAKELDRINENTLISNNLLTAKKMEIDDRNPLTIKRATGWERGSDGKWRYEIDDISMSINKENLPYDISWEKFFDRKEKEKYGNNFDISKLNSKEFVEYKKFRRDSELEYNRRNGTFRNITDIIDYPELFNIYPELKNIRLKYDPSLQKKGYYQPDGRIIAFGDFSNVESLKGLLLHELQHAIQMIEGFPSGGTPSNYTGEDAYDKYNRLGGEVEARNAQNRRILTADQKRNTLLKETEDVRDEDKIYIYDNDSNYSMNITDSDNRLISYNEAKDIVYQFFSPDEIDVEKSTLLFTKDKAFGSYFNSLIKLVENPDITTPYHETVHAYLDKFYNQDEKDELINYVTNLDEYSDKYEKKYSELDPLEAEEEIADMFYSYMRKKHEPKNVVGRLKDYFDRALNFVKSFVGKEDKINKLFDAIEQKKRHIETKDITSEKSVVSYIQNKLDEIGVIPTQRDEELSKTDIKPKSEWIKLEGNNFDIKLKDSEKSIFSGASRLLNSVSDIVGDEVYLVGGAVRDLLMRNANIIDKDVNDLDFTVPSEDTIKELHSYFKENDEYGMDDSGLPFAHIKVIEKSTGNEYEFTAFRKESYRDTSRDPEISQGTIDDEMQRRDFTINSIFAKLGYNENSINLDLNDKTKDFIDDINNGVLRTYNKPEIIFEDDPLRLLRALRFANRYGFELDSNLKNAIDNFDPALMEKVSGERVRDELMKILKTGDDVFAHKIIAKVFPELEDLYKYPDIIEHINRAIKLSRKYNDDVLLWASLFHDISKPQTAQPGKQFKTIYPSHAENSAEMLKNGIMDRLKFTRTERKVVEKITKIHTKAQQISNMSFNKFVDFAISNKDVFPYLMKFQDIDYYAHEGDFFDKVSENEYYKVLARLTSFYDAYENIPEGERKSWEGPDFKQNLKKYMKKNYNENYNELVDDFLKRKDIRDKYQEFAPAFYSKLEEQIKNIEGNNIKVQRLPNLLKNISKDEIKWSGINEFIKENAVDGKISKESLIDYLKDNNTKVEMRFGANPLIRFNLSSMTPEQIKENYDSIDWEHISKTEKLSEDFIRENAKILNWFNISAFQNLSEDFIMEFKDKVDWYGIMKYQKLSDEFIRNIINNYEHKVPISGIINNRSLPEDIIIDIINNEDLNYRNNINAILATQKLTNRILSQIPELSLHDEWKSTISSNDKLSEDFIRDNKSKLDLTKVITYNPMSEDLIEELLDYSVDIYDTDISLYPLVFQEVSEDFIRKYLKNGNVLTATLSNRKLSEDFIREIINNYNLRGGDWRAISGKQKLSDNFILDYRTHLDFDEILNSQNLSEDLIEKLIDTYDIYKYEDWAIVSKNQKLSDSFIEKYKNYVNWANIARYQTLSEDFIKNNINELSHSIDKISEYQKLSDKFIKDNILNLSPLHLLNNENISNDAKKFASRYVSYKDYAGKGMRIIHAKLPIEGKYVESTIISNKSRPYDDDDNTHFSQQKDNISWFLGQQIDINGEKSLFIDEIQSKRHDKGRVSGYSDDYEGNADIKEYDTRIESYKKTLLNINNDVDSSKNKLLDSQYNLEYLKNRINSLIRSYQPGNNVPDYSDGINELISDIEHTVDSNHNYIDTLATDFLDKMYRLSEEGADWNKLDLIVRDYIHDVYAEIRNQFLLREDIEGSEKMIGDIKYKLEDTIKTKEEYISKLPPSAPFNDYIPITIKNALRYAVEHGMDSLIFANGAQILKKYFRDKKIDKDSWQYKMYDEKIPNWLNKYIKQMGWDTELTYTDLSGKVIDTSGGVGEQLYKKQLTIPITQKMKSDILSKGQPLFQKNPYQKVIDKIIESTPKEELYKHYNDTNPYIRSEVVRHIEPSKMSFFLDDDSSLVRDSLYEKAPFDNLSIVFQKDMNNDNLPMLRKRISDEILTGNMNYEKLSMFYATKDPILKDVINNIDFGDKNSLLDAVDKLNNVNDLMNWERGSDVVDKEPTVLDSNKDLHGNSKEEWMNVLSDEVSDMYDYEKYAYYNGIDPDKLSYLGQGDFGVAYSTGDGRVLKITSSKTEAQIAQENLGKQGHFAQIYDVKQIGNEYYILQEELDIDSKVEDLYYELESLLSNEGLHVQYADHLDLDELREQGMSISEELETFIDGISNINDVYRKLGIEASDIRPENLGYNKNGELVAFDLEDKSNDDYNNVEVEKGYLTPIHKALDEGLFHDAISSGKMTVNDAVDIIKSAKINVPNDIDKMRKESENDKSFNNLINKYMSEISEYGDIDTNIAETNIKNKLEEMGYKSGDDISDDVVKSIIDNDHYISSFRSDYKKDVESLKTEEPTSKDKIGDEIFDQDKIYLGITPSTESIKSIKNLLDKANTAKENKDFNKVNENYKKIIEKGKSWFDIKFKNSDEIDYNVNNAMGMFGGYTEPTMDMSVNIFNADKVDDVFISAVDFAKNFKQSNVHVSQKLSINKNGFFGNEYSDNYGKVNDDGSTYQPNATIFLKEQVPDDKIEEIYKKFDEYGLAGFTISDDRKKLEFYTIDIIGDNENAREKYASFFEGTQKLIQHFQSEGSYADVETGVRKLWNFGNKDWGATREYSEVRSEILPRQKEKRINDFSTKIESHIESGSNTPLKLRWNENTEFNFDFSAGMLDISIESSSNIVGNAYIDADMYKQYLESYQKIEESKSAFNRIKNKPGKELLPAISDVNPGKIYKVTDKKLDNKYIYVHSKDDDSESVVIARLDEKSNIYDISELSYDEWASKFSGIPIKDDESFEYSMDNIVNIDVEHLESGDIIHNKFISDEPIKVDTISDTVLTYKKGDKTHNIKLETIQKNKTDVKYASAVKQISNSVRNNNKLTDNTISFMVANYGSGAGNISYICKDKNDSGKGIFKPIEKETPESFHSSIPPKRAFVREVFASDINDKFGIDMVPYTAFKELNGMFGSYQNFVKNAKPLGLRYSEELFETVQEIHSRCEKFQKETGIIINAQDFMTPDFNAKRNKEFLVSKVLYSIGNVEKTVLMDEEDFQEQKNKISSFVDNIIEYSVEETDKVARMVVNQVKDVPKLFILDYLMANSDRHLDNVLIDEGGNLHAIDNGMSLPGVGKLTSFRSTMYKTLDDIDVKKDFPEIYKKITNINNLKKLKKMYVDNGIISKFEFNSFLSRISNIVGNSGIITNFTKNHLMLESLESMSSSYYDKEPDDAIADIEYLLEIFG